MKAFFPNFTFLYIDAEFTPDLHTPGGLVSLALHSEEYGDRYLVNADADREAFCSSDFCRDHIWSKLPLNPDGSLDRTNPSVMSYEDMADAVEAHFYALTGGAKYRQRVGIVADHGTQDMQRIHSLFGNDWFGRMPVTVPRRPFIDLATLEDLAGVEDGRLPDGTPLPEKDPNTAHHALVDARWDREVHEFLLEHSRAVRVASGVERLEN
jgi:hypothetical protein